MLWNRNAEQGVIDDAHDDVPTKYTKRNIMPSLWTSIVNSWILLKNYWYYKIKIKSLQTLLGFIGQTISTHSINYKTAILCAKFRKTYTNHIIDILFCVIHLPYLR